MKEIIENIKKSRLNPDDIWFLDLIQGIEMERANGKHPHSIFFKKLYCL